MRSSPAQRRTELPWMIRTGASRADGATSRLPSVGLRYLLVTIDNDKPTKLKADTKCNLGRIPRRRVNYY